MKTTRPIFGIFLVLMLLVLFSMTLVAQESIGYGDTIEGSIDTAADPDPGYQFEASAGDVITIDMMSADFDTLLFLQDSDGVELTRNDDGGEETNSRILGFVIPNDGTYTIVASHFGLEAQGNFTLSLELVDIDAITVGETVTINMTPETSEITYALTTDLGQVLDIIVDSGSTLDTRIELISPFEFVVEENDDANATIDPAIESFLVENEGRYLIVIRPAKDNANLNGELTLTVQESTLTSLEEGDVELSFSFENQEELLSFAGSAGEQVNFIVTVIDREFASISPFFELSQAGTNFADFSMSGLDEFRVEFVVPEDGTVVLSVQAFSNITMNVSLERISE